MNIDELKIGELKQLTALLGNQNKEQTLKTHIGEKVIIRTYSAGVWFGTLSEKSGNEVILTNARRMWKWWAKKSISLSGVAKYGINHAESKICPAIKNAWMEAIEILPLTTEAINSIEGAEDVEAD